MLLAVVVLKGLVEVLLLTFVAQGILHLFAGSTRDRNIVYKVFVIINRPIWKATRFITPRFIVDAHVGFVSFFFLVLAWLVLVMAKVHFYLEAAKAGA
ncbi:MAG: hypothetical protein ABIQ72_09215 [Usitatibacter sp.]